jgi:hypothetical protein
MAQTVLITLTIAGTDTGPFDLYSDADGYTSPFEINISKAALTAGYTSYAVPNAATLIKIVSKGTCTNSITLPIVGTSATTSTSTSSSTSSSSSSSTSSSTTSTTTTQAAEVRIYAKYVNQQANGISYSTDGINWTNTLLTPNTTECSLFITLTGLPQGNFYLKATTGVATISICNSSPFCTTCPGFSISNTFGCPQVQTTITNGINILYITVDGLNCI